MLAERINAKEIYSFNDGNLIPKHDTQLNTFLRYFVGISLPLILIMRLSNLISFNDFSWYFKSVYVGIICYVLSVRANIYYKGDKPILAISDSYEKRLESISLSVLSFGFIALIVGCIVISIVGRKLTEESRSMLERMYNS